MLASAAVSPALNPLLLPPVQRPSSPSLALICFPGSGSASQTSLGRLQGHLTARRRQKEPTKPAGGLRKGRSEAVRGRPRLASSRRSDPGSRRGSSTGKLPPNFLPPSASPAYPHSARGRPGPCPLPVPGSNPGGLRTQDPSSKLGPLVGGNWLLGQGFSSKTSLSLRWGETRLQNRLIPARGGGEVVVKNKSGAGNPSSEPGLLAREGEGGWATDRPPALGLNFWTGRHPQKGGDPQSRDCASKLDPNPRGRENRPSPGSAAQNPKSGRGRGGPAPGL